MLNSDEMRQALAQVEQEAIQHSQDLVQVHSGLNEQRVARLLGLSETDCAVKKGAVWWFTNRTRLGETQTMLKAAVPPELA